MNWYEAHYLCKNCKGCEAVADGEANCLVDEEAKIEIEVISETGILYDDEEEF